MRVMLSVYGGGRGQGQSQYGEAKGQLTVPACNPGKPQAASLITLNPNRNPDPFPKSSPET